MSIHSIYLTLENSVPSRSFKILKQFDPSLTLGPFLAKLKSGEPIVQLEHFLGEDLERVINLLDQLAADEVYYSLSIATEPKQRNLDGSKIRSSSVAELRLEFLKYTEYDKRAAAFRRFCNEQGFKDGHWILIDRERLFKSTLRRFTKRSRTKDWSALLDEEINWRYIHAFELDLFRGGFGAYFAGEDGNSAKELAAALRDVGSSAVLKLLRQAICLLDAGGGYSNQSDLRVPNLSRCSIDLFNEVDTQFCNRAEDIGGMALSELEGAYEDM